MFIVVGCLKTKKTVRSPGEFVRWFVLVSSSFLSLSRARARVLLDIFHNVMGLLICVAFALGYCFDLDRRDQMFGPIY